MAISMGMLRGEALTDWAGGEEIVQHFPAYGLSSDPPQRFAMLFAARPRWELPDLEPYLADLQVTASATA
jgi:sister chromatid cohesion protein DCC1